MMMQLFWTNKCCEDQFPFPVWILAFICQLEHVCQNKLARTFNWVTKPAMIGGKGVQEVAGMDGGAEGEAA